MKYLEILIKLWFIGSAIAVYVTRDSYCLIKTLAAASLALGVVLIFNKDHSYYWYRASGREIIIRKIEGVILVVFGSVLFTLSS